MAIEFGSIFVAACTPSQGDALCSLDLAFGHSKTRIPFGFPTANPCAAW
jgi:hypothetical protein